MSILTTRKKRRGDYRLSDVYSSFFSATSFEAVEKSQLMPFITPYEIPKIAPSSKTPTAMFARLVKN
jgi:hypothetical protein